MSCSIYMYHFLNYKYLLSQTGSVLMWENTSNFNLIICAQSSVKLEKKRKKKYVCTYLNIHEIHDHNSYKKNKWITRGLHKPYYSPGKEHIF